MTIEVKIVHKESGAELGLILIENASKDAGDLADYAVQYGVERITGVGISKRGIFNFPRLEYNVLGLLLQALNALSPEELKLDGKADPPDLARGLNRGGKKVQGWSRFMRNH